MIIFYKKGTGEIIGTVGGRVHGKEQMACNIGFGKNGQEEMAEKLVIGWEETPEIDHYEEVDNFIPIEEAEFKKLPPESKKRVAHEEYEGSEGYPVTYYEYFKKEKVKLPIHKTIEHNLDKFQLLQKFEDDSPVNPMDYKIDLKKMTLIKK